MLQRLLLACAAIGTFALTSCDPAPEGTASVPAQPGIILANMDTTVNPRDDFYAYVNGNWERNTEIPADRTRWGGFSVLRKSTDADMLEIINDAIESGRYAPDTDQAKALALYQGYLDTLARNEAALAPLLPALEQIDAVKTLADLQAIMQDVETPASTPFLGVSGFADLNNSSVNAAYVGGGNFGLPDRDFYLESDDKSKEIREKYVGHISRVLQMFGDEEPIANSAAERILNLEAGLAEAQLDKVQRRNPGNYNNPRSLDEFQDMMPTIDVPAMMSALGLEDVDTVMLTDLGYLRALNTFLAEADIEDIKAMARWSTINRNAGRLSTELDRANWEFYSQYLNGAQAQRPIEERALAMVSGVMGEALGQLYVDAKFPPEAKAKAELMIDNIILAFQQRINNLDWMSADTKAKAIEKLDKFTVKIAYPDEWEDYSTLAVAASDSYYANRVAADIWAGKKNLAEIGEPVDKSEWGMAPQTVNAYFNPLNNEIVFPAAILQPPFYNYQADEAVNYGGIGAVIGHEISHAFDDQGARFDGDGNLVNWWGEEDLAAFTERGKALADQYSAIEVLDSVYINGDFTLGENIGDLGGVLGAYDGLQLYYAEHGRPEKIDGFTPEQRFFMSWATVWRTLQREESLRNQVKTDPHSPGRVRATQPLVNIDAFYDAFDIQQGDAMYLAPEERVRIW